MRSLMSSLLFSPLLVEPLLVELLCFAAGSAAVAAPAGLRSHSLCL